MATTAAKQIIEKLLENNVKLRCSIQKVLLRSVVNHGWEEHQTRKRNRGIETNYGKQVDDDDNKDNKENVQPN